MLSLYLKTDRNVPYVAIENVNKELDRLAKSEVIKKVDYLKWAALVSVYVG